MVLFAACSNDDESGWTVCPDNLPKAVYEAFSKQFPNARDVKWTEKNDYHVASFLLASTKSRAEADGKLMNEAWYTNDGVCRLSELELSAAELEMTYPKVFAAWKATRYFKEGYVIDDIDLLQRSDDAKDRVIKIEVEKGNVERELYFTLDGVLVKDAEDAEDALEENLPCPQVLTSYVNLHYPGAIILDYEQNATTKAYGVEILVTQMGFSLEKLLVFNPKFEFVFALVDIDEEQLPEFIKTILDKEQLAQLIVLTGEDNPAEWDIEMTENAAGEIILSVENADDQRVDVLKLDKNLKPIK